LEKAEEKPPAIPGKTPSRQSKSPWPIFHGNIQHTGVSPYDTSYIDGTEKWSFEAGAGIESSPAIGTDGTVYFGSHDGFLYAVNPDCTEKWRFNAGPPVYDERWDVSKSTMASPAVVEGGTIYVYSSANYLFDINPDGTEKWRYKTPDAFEGVSSSAAIGADGTIYVGANSGNFYAFNPDGTVKWEIDTLGPTISSPAIDYDGTIYFGSWDHNFYAIGSSSQDAPSSGGKGDKQDTVSTPPRDGPSAGPDPEFDYFTWTLPVGASPLRLSLPADIDDFLFGEHGGIGGYGLHAGGHIEGLDHVWIELKPRTPVRSWADGVVQDVRYQGPPVGGEYHITIDYGQNLIGIHMEVMTPYVAKGDRMSRGQEVGRGMSFDPHQSSVEQSLIDLGRTDGVKAWGGGVYVSPFDYLEREDKLTLIEAYMKQVIEPYKHSGEEMWGFHPY
jgi:hypothetical protein